MPCRVWLITDGKGQWETLRQTMADSRLGHQLQPLAGLDALETHLRTLPDGDPDGQSAPDLLFLQTGDNRTLSGCMTLIHSVPLLQPVPVVVLPEQGQALDLRSAYARGVNSVIRLPGEQGAMSRVLAVVADYWLAVLPLARSSG